MECDSVVWDPGERINLFIVGWKPLANYLVSYCTSPFETLAPTSTPQRGKKPMEDYFHLDHHVGVNINNMISNASGVAANYVDETSIARSLPMDNGKTILAWVDSNFAMNKLVVGLSLIFEKPKGSTLPYNVDSSPYLDEFVYVEFSTSTGLLTSSPYIIGWSLNVIGGYIAWWLRTTLLLGSFIFLSSEGCYIIWDPVGQILEDKDLLKGKVLIHPKAQIQGPTSEPTIEIKMSKENGKGRLGKLCCFSLYPFSLFLYVLLSKTLTPILSSLPLNLIFPFPCLPLLLYLSPVPIYLCLSLPVSRLGSLSITILLPPTQATPRKFDSVAGRFYSAAASFKAMFDGYNLKSMRVCHWSKVHRKFNSDREVLHD